MKITTYIAAYSSLSIHEESSYCHRSRLDRNKCFTITFQINKTMTKKALKEIRGVCRYWFDDSRCSNKTEKHI